MFCILRRFSRGLLRSNPVFISQANLAVKERLAQISRVEELKKFVDENETVFRHMGPVEFLLQSFERAAASARSRRDASSDEMFELVVSVVRFAGSRGSYKDLIKFRQIFRELRPFNEEQMRTLLELPEILRKRTSPMIMRVILIIECLRNKVAVEKARELIPKIVKDISKGKLIIESNPGMYIFSLISQHRDEFPIEIRTIIRWLNLFAQDGQSQLTKESQKLGLEVILNYSKECPDLESKVNKVKLGISDCNESDSFTKLITNVPLPVQLQPSGQRPQGR